MSSGLPIEEIQTHLDVSLEVEFSFLHTDQLAETLLGLERHRQEFVLAWTRRAAATNVQLAYEFAALAGAAVDEIGHELVEAWCLHAMHAYDRSGLHAAMEVIRNLDDFRVSGQQRAAASLFDEAVPVLLPFIHGLAGRRLKIQQADVAWTDGETLYLPDMMAALETVEDNFQLYKATVVHLWAQTRFGTLNVNLAERFAAFADPAYAQALFHALETIRLDARIASELPGLHRRMQGLRTVLGEPDWPAEWKAARQVLAQPDATVRDSLDWLEVLYDAADPVAACYQGELRPAAAWQARELRLLRDRARLREALRVVANEIAKGREADEPPEAFELREGDEDKPDAQGIREVEITLSDQPIPISDAVRDTLTSILLDLEDIPPEYLTPAGPGEYDPSLLEDRSASPDDAWAGTYHEEGAALYKEWDFARQSYKKNWCVLREIDVQPVELDFYHRTLRKYRPLLHSLRRTFEILKGEDKLLKRQRFGEDVDIDALVESWGDLQAGHELSEYLFTRMHKEERSIAVIFMVDMSGSTRGWINDAERESLILLAESLEALGDRYAIYGFSGWTRKRCEAFRVKRFDEPWDDTTIGRVCGIEPKDYTRMGAPIRHLVEELKQVEARTKLLITLSDGKPDDYDLEYRGEYGIEDTRQALYEARMAGVHAFCITIDEEGPDYLPHMYGAANYAVIDEVAKLPLKVSDIYRKLTS
jgi:nitric oxide reductase NorD protein